MRLPARGPPFAYFHTEPSSTVNAGEIAMKTPLTTPYRRLFLSMVMTLLSVHVIADYAYPEPANAPVVLASNR